MNNDLLSKYALGNNSGWNPVDDSNFMNKAIGNMKTNPKNQELYFKFLMPYLVPQEEQMNPEEIRKRELNQKMEANVLAQLSNNLLESGDYNGALQTIGDYSNGGINNVLAAKNKREIDTVKSALPEYMRKYFGNI